MVRDPSIVSPSLTGVFIGGGHNKHGTGSRCTLPKQCRPPSPRRRWRCDRSSYKRSLVSRIRDSLTHYLTGPEIIETTPVTVSGLRGIEPLRDGQAHNLSSASLACKRGYLSEFLLCKRGGGSDGVCGGRGQGMSAGEGNRLFLSLFAFSLRFSLQPSCHLAVAPFSSFFPLSLLLV